MNTPNPFLYVFCFFVRFLSVDSKDVDDARTRGIHCRREYDRVGSMIGYRGNVAAKAEANVDSQADAKPEEETATKTEQSREEQDFKDAAEFGDEQIIELGCIELKAAEVKAEAELEAANFEDVENGDADFGFAEEV